MNRILQNLMLASGQKILPEKTLIIFDEVQDCPKVINSMKYFCENAPQYHVACAGSLLGITLAKPSSFPVGKVNFMKIEPMTFTEFLLANGDGNLADYLNHVDTIEPLPDAFFNPLYEKLKMYYVTGGMPEPVLMWTKARDVNAMQEALADIIGAYERDFGKHPNVSEFPKISMIWKSIPSQLAPTAFGEGNRLFTEFKELFQDQVKLRVRFSLANLKLDEDVLNIPLFMADHANRLIGMALEQQKR